MKPSDSPDSLSSVLASWRVTPSSDPQFRPAVWTRLEAVTRRTWAAYVQAHLARWSVVAALGIITAGWAGHAAAQARLEGQREAMIVNYLGDLDPRVQARLRPELP